MYTTLKDLELNKPLELKGYYSWESKNTNGTQYLMTSFTDVAGDVAYNNIFSNKKEYNIFKSVPQCFCQMTVTFLGEANGYPKYSFSNIIPLMDPNKGDLALVEGLNAELEKYIEGINDESLKKIVQTAYQDNKDLICQCPASMLSGYSYPGGLLAQIVRLCKLVESTCAVYQSWNYNSDSLKLDLNYDALIAAAIISEMGAINYYFVNNNKVEKKFCGKLSSKESLCMCFSDMYLVDLLKEDPDKFFLFRHILENCNSKMYNVSVPRTLEANILASLKELDKKAANFEFLHRLPTTEEFVKLNGKEYCLMPFNEKTT
ncbi:hypothetical protein [Clostridium sp.]|uniref:hypothetical protein n=1 Tax=Clostridium sp. TaxID=1506 RepID=UPI001B758344|nr:hypothetical protein [Clostridium sp.]MBP3914457.1 hypothetical protein [Clostridium sp.]